MQAPTKKDTEEERNKEAAEVGVGKEIMEEGGGGEATKESPGQEDMCSCLFSFVFVFIKSI